MNLKQLTLFISHIVVFNCFGQNSYVKYFDIKDGLSHNSVICILQDTEGYMWFGTYDGLNRYDGYNFKIYKNKIGDSTSLKSNTITCLSKDNLGNMWVGGSKGISLLKKNTESFRSVYYRSTENDKKVSPVTMDIKGIQMFKDGGILVASSEGGLIYFKPRDTVGVQIPISYKGYSGKMYNASSINYDASSNSCWIIVQNLGVYKFNMQTKELQLYSDSEINIMNILVETANDMVWVATENGLNLYSLKDKSLKHQFLKGNAITHILRDSSGVLWVTTDGSGVYTYNSPKKIFEPYRSIANQQISGSTAFYTIYEDKDHNYWLGSIKGGVSLIGKNAKKFTKYLIDPNNNLNTYRNYISSFCEVKKTGEVYVGTSGAGIFKWHKGTDIYESVIPKNKDYSSKLITGITEGKDDNIWISTWNGGINRWNKKTNTIRYFECFNKYTHKLEKNIWFVFKDVDGGVWAGATNSGTLYKYNEIEEKFEVFNSEIKDLQCIIQTKDKTLWAGDYTSLIKLDIDSHTFKSYETGYTVRSLNEDSDGNLWVGTQEGGLLLFSRENNSFKRFTNDDGLPDNTILRILEDKNHNLWMSSYNGIIKFNRKDKFYNFSVSDGLQSNQFSFNGALKLSTGELVFGGASGFNMFDPELIKISSANKTVRLSDIYINNKSLEAGYKGLSIDETNNQYNLTVPYNETAISIEFISIDFIHQDKIQYAYKLEGWDDHWSYGNNTRKANYSKLLEGDYTFRVKTRNESGTWGNAVILANISVSPPWYRTWWAYFTYLLVIAVIIYFSFSYSRNKVLTRQKIALAQLESKKEKEMAQRQRDMFTYITHEFRTPLTLIINPLKKVIKKTETEVGDDVSVAHRNARRLLSLVDQLLIFRKAENDSEEIKVKSFNLKELVEDIYSCFQYRAKEKEINFSMKFDTKDTMISGDYEKLEIVLFNLLANAFKFSNNYGEIKIEVSDSDAEYKITVSDTGIGIEEEELEHIFDKFYQNQKSKIKVGGFGIGLYIVKYFIEKHNGKIYCISNVGVGTSFTVVLPKGEAYEKEVNLDGAKNKRSPLLEELLDGTLQPKQVTKIEKPKRQPELITDKRTVMIIEDMEDMRTYLEKLFSDKYIVYTATNGKEGLDMIKGQTPDIVISDVSMDGMDGIELCEKLKSNELYNHIPVILLTSSSSSEMQLKGITKGADDYITKPFDNEILLARVDTLVKSRNQLRRYFLDSITLKENRHKVPQEYRDFLDRCLAIVEANLNNENFKIQDFSDAMGMSHSSLYKRIKAISGQTISSFIRSVRLRQAAVILLTNNITIAEAGLQVGIENQKYFRKKFTELFGVTPSEYIKKYRGSFNKELNVIRRNI